MEAVSSDCIDSVKEKIIKYFDRLVSEVQSRKQVLLDMADFEADLYAKAKTKLNGNAVHSAFPGPLQTDVETSIEFKAESLVSVATHGHLVLCQRNCTTGIESIIHDFVEVGDVEIYPNPWKSQTLSHANKILHRHHMQPVEVHQSLHLKRRTTQYNVGTRLHCCLLP